MTTAFLTSGYEVELITIKPDHKSQNKLIWLLESVENASRYGNQ
jgi:hypothetical protein